MRPLTRTANLARTFGDLLLRAVDVTRGAMRGRTNGLLDRGALQYESAHRFTLCTLRGSSCPSHSIHPKLGSALERIAFGITRIRRW